MVPIYEGEWYRYNILTKRGNWQIGKDESEKDEKD